jgi:histidinol-phosphate aminotransferase
MDIGKLAKPNIRSLKAYKAEEIPCKVKLDANESPYPPFSVLRTAYCVQKKIQSLNRYPDPEAKNLRKLLAKEYKVKSGNILQGNGSDELIYYLITAFGGPVLYPTPTFSMYGIISQALGEKKIEIPLDREFDLNTDALLETIKKQKPKLIFLSSPNNPTGNCFSSEKILRIIDAVSTRGTKYAVRSLVVVDEAYQAFSKNKSFVTLLKKYKNLIILKTLSKIGMAGLRVGFLIADSEIINEVNKVRLPFNLNSLSQTIAVEALKNKKLVQANIKAIISERESLFSSMKKIRGIKPYPSEANFILFKVKNPDKIYTGLLKKGVLVRNMKGIINGCLRVTVGTPRENTVFLRILKDNL